MSQKETNENFEYEQEHLKEFEPNPRDAVLELQKRRGKLAGIDTGYKGFNNALSGLRGLVLIGSQPNAGKTSLALNIASHALQDKEEKIGILFFCLDMSKSDIDVRLAQIWHNRTWHDLKEAEHVNDIQTKMPGQTGFLGVFDNRLFETRAKMQAIKRLTKASNQSTPPAEHHPPQNVKEARAAADKVSEAREAEAKKSKVKPVAADYIAAIQQQADALKLPMPKHENDLKNKGRYGCDRVVVVIDYLQCFSSLLSDAKFAIEQDREVADALVAIADHSTIDCCLCVAEVRKPTKEKETGDWMGSMADIMGSARLAYAPDFIIALRAPEFLETEGKQIKIKSNNSAYIEALVLKARDGGTRSRRGAPIRMVFQFTKNVFIEMESSCKDDPEKIETVAELKTEYGFETSDTDKPKSQNGKKKGKGKAQPVSNEQMQRELAEAKEALANEAQPKQA